MRRLFYVALGATAGVLAVRRASAALQRWTPEGVAGQLGGAGERVALWWAEVQALAAAREDELRHALGLDAAQDDQPPATIRSVR
ncbi:MAG: hypothetical protein JO079_02975 [Frankiaceae bacterium]|nr:hypothetical protein [Frankiaceae bacterium]MBV9369127.1 hypothetical protein [Frankiales bacterium]